jgi:nuclear receptor subfamily 1 group D protein 2
MKDDSIESDWDDSIEAIVALIMDVVKCSKYIPGFGELQQHDQVQLLKQGSFEVICVNSFNLIDIERKLMLSHDLKYLMDR